MNIAQMIEAIRSRKLSRDDVLGDHGDLDIMLNRNHFGPARQIAEVARESYLIRGVPRLKIAIALMIGARNDFELRDAQAEWDRGLNELRSHDVRACVPYAIKLAYMYLSRNQYDLAHHWLCVARPYVTERQKLFYLSAVEAYRGTCGPHRAANTADLNL